MSQEASGMPRHELIIADLSSRRATEFLLEPNASDRAALAQEVDVVEIRKLRFAGSVEPAGKTDWTLRGQLGATIIQLCGVTLVPVTTRIEEPVVRRYLSEIEEDPGAGSETEMPEDDTVELLGRSINLEELMTEVLALAIPPYPRAEGAELGQAQFTAPGLSPMSDDDARPLAGLADLKRKLEGKE